MAMKTKQAVFILVAFFLCACLKVAIGGERSDIIFANSLDEEIVIIRVLYATPYDEPRYSASDVYLPPQQEYRIGVQGTTHPESIYFDLATRVLSFPDISALNPDGFMRLEITYENNKPVLRRLDGEDAAEIQGTELAVLSKANRPNAVDRDSLTAAVTMDEVIELVKETAASAQEEMGELRELEIEAGPIWNNDHALARCPEVVDQWNEANGGAARWTGNWSTTVPGEMSVCGCFEGTVGIDDTLLVERVGDTGEQEALRFPVAWKDWTGAAQVQAIDDEIGVALSFRLSDVDNITEMLEELLVDLRVDDFRPLSFRIRAWDGEEAAETELAFSEDDGDKYDHQEKLQELLFSSYDEGSLVRAVAFWVTEDAFDRIKAGEDAPAGKGVMVTFTKGTFSAIFIPDARMVLP